MAAANLDGMESAGPTLAPGRRTFEPRHAFPLIAAGGLAFAAVAAFTAVPLPPCPFRLLTGLPCPGCGMTRSLSAMLHGNLALSFRYHPLGPVLFAGAVACLALPLLHPATVHRLQRALPRQEVVAATVVGLFLLVWLVRLAFILKGSGYFLW